jgi:hypothetical protein
MFAKETRNYDIAMRGLASRHGEADRGFLSFNLLTSPCGFSITGFFFVLAPPGGIRRGRLPI